MLTLAELLDLKKKSAELIARSVRDTQNDDYLFGYESAVEDIDMHVDLYNYWSEKIEKGEYSEVNNYD